MKKQFNLKSDTFTHLTGGNKGYSVHGKESQYIEWVKDDSLEHTFYVDDTIPTAFSDKVSGKKYAWLLESKYIKPGIVQPLEPFPSIWVLLILVNTLTRMESLTLQKSLMYPKKSI